MAKMYSYGGLILPMAPFTEKYGTEWTVIFLLDGFYYHYDAQGSGLTLIGVDPSTNMLWFRVKYGTPYRLENGKWVAQPDFEINTPIVSADNVIWTRGGIGYCKFGDITVNKDFMSGSEPVLVSDGDITLEALPTGILEVTESGATGIIVGARMRYADGTTTDVSTEANYSLDAFQAQYASLDAGRQIVINEGYPYSDVEVHITYDNLPGQTATLIVMVNIESGGEGGGEDPDNPDIPDVPVDPDEPENPEVTAEQKREYYWRGFASAVAMYGGAVTAGNNAVATNEVSGDIPSELRKAYWRGFASGAAIYGKGVI